MVNIRVGLCNEKQSTLGALTAQLLNKQDIYDNVVKNVVSRTPTADLLVNQIRTGSLDAAVVYLANTTVARHSLDIIEIGLPGNKRQIRAYAMLRIWVFAH